MTPEEYQARADALLKRLGGTYAAPSGWMKEGLQFSCRETPVPIYIPFPESLEDDEQRRIVMERLERKYLDT